MDTVFQYWKGCFSFKKNPSSVLFDNIPYISESSFISNNLSHLLRMRRSHEISKSTRVAVGDFKGVALNSEIVFCFLQDALGIKEPSNPHLHF